MQLLVYLILIHWKVIYQVACSKRSDSGERCEVKKARKSRGHRSPLSERLEQAIYQVDSVIQLLNNLGHDIFIVFQQANLT